jgi:hypothetical protein
VPLSRSGNGSRMLPRFPLAVLADRGRSWKRLKRCHSRARFRPESTHPWAIGSPGLGMPIAAASTLCAPMGILRPFIQLPHVRAGSSPVGAPKCSDGSFPFWR